MSMSITKNYQAKPKMSISITEQERPFTISTSIINHYQAKPRTSMTINKHYQPLPTKTKQALPIAI